MQAIKCQSSNGSYQEVKHYSISYFTCSCSNCNSSIIIIRYCVNTLGEEMVANALLLLDNDFDNDLQVHNNNNMTHTVHMCLMTC